MNCGLGQGRGRQATHLRSRVGAAQCYYGCCACTSVCVSLRGYGRAHEQAPARQHQHIHCRRQGCGLKHRPCSVQAAAACSRRGGASGDCRLAYQTATLTRTTLTPFPARSWQESRRSLSVLGMSRIRPGVLAARSAFQAGRSCAVGHRSCSCPPLSRRSESQRLCDATIVTSKEGEGSIGISPPRAQLVQGRPSPRSQTHHTPEANHARWSPASALCLTWRSAVAASAAPRAACRRASGWSHRCPGCWLPP